MAHLVKAFLRALFKLLNHLFKICWFIPLHIEDDECVLRAIYTPIFFDKKKKDTLKPVAFHPSPGTDEISVMRFSFLRMQVCKEKAHSIQNPAKDKNYCGFTILKVAAIRKLNIDVWDSRKNNYCGHADIKLFINELIKPQTRQEPQEPLPPHIQDKLLNLKKQLLAASKYFPDPQPLNKHWYGEKLEPPATTAG